MKGYKIYLILGVLLISVYLVAQYNKPVPTDWSATYLPKDKIPFGTYILRNRIKDVLPAAQFKTTDSAIYNTFKNSKFTNTSFIIISAGVKINKTDFEQLKLFMKRGNDVFIAAYELGPYLNKELKINSTTRYGSSEENVSVNFVNPSLKSDADYRFEKEIGNQYFSEFDTSKATILGRNGRGDANFIKYNYKKGNLFLMAEPGFYTNFNLLDRDGAEYAAKSLSYLKHSKAVIWDNYSIQVGTEDKSMLRVFFKNPELKHAYYLTIISLIIFVFYEIKRRQRIIPIMDPYANTSVEFVNVVGSLYFNERDNLDLAQKKVNLFLAHLRNKYFLKTNEIDKDFASVLMQKTGINEILAKTLTRYFIQVPLTVEFNDTQLINLNDTIEQFYKTTQPHGGTI